MVEKTSRLGTTSPRQRPSNTLTVPTSTCFGFSTKLFRRIMDDAADPRVEIGQSARAQGRLLRAARGLAAQRREQPEIDVHGLERPRPGIDGLDMAAGDVAKERAVRCGGRRQRRLIAEPLGSGKAAGEQSDRRRFHVAFAAGDLSGEAQPRIGFKPQARIEKPWRIEKGV